MRFEWSTRWVRIVRVALTSTLAIAVLMVLPNLLGAIPRPVARQGTEWFLEAVLVAYAGALTLALAGPVVLVPAVVRARRRGGRRPLASRLLLLSASSLVGLLALEA